MKVTDYAISRSSTIYVLLTIILAMGTYSYVTMPRESAPDVIVPFINVNTRYEGVAPSDIETLVTIPIERKLTGISGVKKIMSQSYEGLSGIVIEFQADSDIDEALQKVKDKVDLAKQDLPEEADDPVIYEVNIAELPIIRISLSGETGTAVLNEIADEIEDRIEAIKGVLDVNIIGKREREIYIEVDPKRVAQYGISLVDLVTVTELENVNTPAGSLNIGEAKYLMRVPGEIRSPDELLGLVVRSGPSGVVYLRDIATVRDGFEEPTTISRVNGRPSLTIAVSKRSGENVLKISEDVKNFVEDARKNLPPTCSLDIIEDEADNIRELIGDLENNILSGLILVVIIIMIFMGLANAFFVSLAIPFSMLIAFVVLNMLGITLNMVVLFSLVFSLGMLVDNGIVVVENIYRLVCLGVPRVEAARRGVSEVAMPIIGSTMTTVVAFVPLLFWPGIWGSFMSYLPKTVIATLMGSLFVGLLCNPVFAAHFMRRPHRSMANREHKPHPILDRYEQFLRLAIRWRGVTATLAFTTMLSIATVYLSGATVEFTPDTEPLQAMILVEMPEGTSLDKSDEVVREIEQRLEPIKEYTDFILANVGEQGGRSMGAGSGVTTHLSNVIIDFPRIQVAKKLPSEILNSILHTFDDMSGVKIRFEKAEQGPPLKPPVNIEISGTSFDVLKELSEQAQELIKDIPAIHDIHDGLDEGKPEVRVRVDREQEWLTGLNTQFVGMTVKAAIDGMVAGKYREGDDEYDVIVRFPEEFRQDLSNIKEMNLINLSGQPIAFGSVAKLEQTQGYGSIERINRRRTITVSADVIEPRQGGRPAAAVLIDVRNRLQEKLALPPGYIVNYTGENEDQEDSMRFLVKAFGVSLLLISLVLVFQFNSVTQTLIIMSSVVLSLAGVFLGLLVHDLPFGVIMTGMAVISLAGVVVNNAIVLIDFINARKVEGVDTIDAIVDAGITRFRPVMLTAVTTVLGLVPMALGISFDFRTLEWSNGGYSSQWWGPMAIAIIWGLSIATVLTLVVVPTLYSFTDSISSFFMSLVKSEAVPEPELESPIRDPQPDMASTHEPA
jgi:multidrug efflux pump